MQYSLNSSSSTLQNFTTKGIIFSRYSPRKSTLLLNHILKNKIKPNFRGAVSERAQRVKVPAAQSWRPGLDPQNPGSGRRWELTAGLLWPHTLIESVLHASHTNNTHTVEKRDNFEILTCLTYSMASLPTNSSNTLDVGPCCWHGVIFGQLWQQMFNKVYKNYIPTAHD